MLLHIHAGINFNIFILDMNLKLLIHDYNGISQGPVIKKSFHISLGLVQEDVTPLLMHWIYVFLPLTHQFIVCDVTIIVQGGMSTAILLPTTYSS